LQEKCEKLKAIEAKLEDDRNQLRLALDDAENRATRSELLRCSQEGDLQRVRMTVAEKEVQIQALVGRAESLASQLADTESSAQALQSNVSRLSTALAMSDEEIGVQKDKVSVCRIK
jgi:chromosome segregation ATPase